MTAPSSIEAQEWLADYQGCLETARQEWTANSVAGIKARPLPEGLPEERAEIITMVPDDK